MLDTRATGVTVDGLNRAEGPRAADSQYRLQIAGRPGVPTDARTAIIYVTAVRPGGTGFVTVHPCQPTPPNASSLNYVANVNGGNEIIAQLDANGRTCIYTSNATHLTVDIVATT